VEVRFSVIVPAFNAARTVGSTIRSVLAQTRQDFEVVVVDDGSTDSTIELVREFERDPRIRLLRQSNGGPSAARNTGIAAARGGYVSMLDADDLWLPEYLELMGAALDEAPGAVLAYTDAWVLDDASGRIRRRSAMSYQRPPKHVGSPRELFLLLLERNFIYTSVTVRRATLEQVGGYDESLGASEDWELWLRIAALGAPLICVPGMLAIHRNHASSLTSDPRTIVHAASEVYRRFVEDGSTDPEAQAVARRRLAYCTAYAESLERPDAKVRLRRRAGATKRRLLDRWIWRRRPPAAVALTLRAVRELQ
jgi:GT2 family glycosyltransferase